MKNVIKLAKGSLNNIFQDSFNRILSQQLTHDKSYILINCFHVVDGTRGFCCHRRLRSDCTEHPVSSLIYTLHSFIVVNNQSVSLSCRRTVSVAIDKELAIYRQMID